MPSGTTSNSGGMWSTTSRTATPFVGGGSFGVSPFTLDNEDLVSAMNGIVEQYTKKPLSKKEIEEKEFKQRIKSMIQNGQALSKLDYRRYMLILKNSRHIDRDQRNNLHRLADDGAKTMASCNVDDLV